MRGRHSKTKRSPPDRYRLAIESLIKSIRISGAKHKISIRDIERLAGNTHGAKFRRSMLIELIVNLRNKSASR